MALTSRRRQSSRPSDFSRSAQVSRVWRVLHVWLGAVSFRERRSSLAVLLQQVRDAGRVSRSEELPFWIHRQVQELPESAVNVALS